MSIQVQDSDGTLSNVATQTVAVASVAPTVTFSSAPSSANEGDTDLFTFTVTEPPFPEPDSVASATPADGTVTPLNRITTFSVVSATATDGTVSNVTITSMGQSATGSFDVTFLDGPATSVVSIQVRDKGEALSNIATQTVAVANVAPTVTLCASNPSSADVGDTDLYTFNVTDPGILDTFSVVSAIATDGTVSNVTIGSTAGTATGSFDVTFTSGSAAANVSIQVQNNDGGLSNTATQTVAVANVAPTVTLSPSNPSSVTGGTRISSRSTSRTPAFSTPSASRRPRLRTGP